MSVAQDILKLLARGPRVSSEIYNQLEKRGHKRDTVKATANSLVGKKIYRSQLNLSHNDSVLSLSENFSNPALIKDLVDKRFYGRLGVASLVDHLRLSNPIVSQPEVAKLAALRIGTNSLPDWSETDRVISGLTELGILKERSDNEKEWILNKGLLAEAGIQFTEINMSSSNAAVRENLRNLQAQALSEWLANNGFVSVGGSKIITQDRPVVSGYGLPFDFLGFCFINGVILRKKGEASDPLPLLGDVVIDVCSLTYAQSFKLRITEAYGVTKRVPMGFILAKGFSKDAFNFLKTEGIHAWAFDNLFGNAAANAIDQILSISQTMAKGAKPDPSKFAKALNGIEAFGGPIGNLKGQLFELIVGYFVSRERYEDVQLGKKIPFDEQSKKLDLDVLAKSNRTAIFFECKGIAADNTVDPKEVRKHFTVRTPATRAMLLKNSVSIYDKFESIVVTTGVFSDETLTAFRGGGFKSKSDTKFELWDRKTFLKKLKDAGHGAIVKIIEQYFASKSVDKPKREKKTN